MRALVIDDAAKRRVAELKAYAEQHRYSMDDLKKLCEPNPGIPIPGDDPSFSMHMSRGFRIVYTQEYQEIGLCHHLSVSVDHTGNPKYPNFGAVMAIMELFGMGKDKDIIRAWPDKDTRSANVLSLVKEDNES